MASGAERQPAFGHFVSSLFVPDINVFVNLSKSIVILTFCWNTYTPFIPPAVCSRSLPLLWGWLQSSALVVVKLWILFQQPPSLFVSTANSLLYDSTAFVHPVASELLLKRFLHNVLQLGSFLFLCDFPRHLLYMCDRLCLYSSRSSQSRACRRVFESPISCRSASSDFLIANV